MRLLRTVLVIIGFFQPLVIPAQPYGDTEVVVFDTDFLPAPRGAEASAPSEPPLPSWVEWSPDPVPEPPSPPISPSESPE